MVGVNRSELETQIDIDKILTDDNYRIKKRKPRPRDLFAKHIRYNSDFESQKKTQSIAAIDVEN